jgi:hypothetical protein
MAACCPCLFHNIATIEEGDNIVVITFFTAKPPKKTTTIIVAFLCNEIIEEGDRSFQCLFLLLKHREEGDDNKLPTLSSL